MQIRTQSPTDSDITFTSTQCNLCNGYTQGFHSIVVANHELPATIRANVVGNNFREGHGYRQINQVSMHWPDLVQGVVTFKTGHVRAREMTPERAWEERMVDLSDSGNMDLGAGVTLYDVCGAK